MSNTAEIQGKLSLKISDFNAALQEAEKSHNASTGRMSAAEKKAASEREKVRKQEAADEAKALAERVKAADRAHKEMEDARKKATEKAKSAGSSLAGGLSAGNSGEIIATGFEAIGALGGPITAVAAGAGLVAKAMYDASENARVMHREWEEIARDSSFMNHASAGFGELVGQAGKIGERFRAIGLEKQASMDRLGFAGGLIKNTVSNGLLSGLGEHANDAWAKHKFAMLGGAVPIPGLMGPVGTAAGAWLDKKTGQDKNQTTKEKQDQQDKELLKERTRLLGEAAMAEKEDLDAATQRVQMGERAGAVAEEELASKREIAALEAALKKTGVAQGAIDGLTGPMKERLKLKTGEINRRDTEAQREIDDTHLSAVDRGDVENTAARSKVLAGEMEVARLEREAARERGKSAATNNVDRKRGFDAKADDLELQARQARFKLTEMQRDLEEKVVDAGRAQEQTAVSLLGLTAPEVANRAQMALLTERIADNVKRMAYADEARRLALQQQNVELDAQVKRLAIMDQMKTPQQKRDERAAGRKARRAEKTVEARAKDAARTIKNGGQRIHNGDAVLRGLDRPAPLAADLGKAIDGSQLAKDIAAIALSMKGKRKFG